MQPMLALAILFILSLINFRVNEILMRAFLTIKDENVINKKLV
jgi:hypothetical protein